jgi:hypothetical protein
MFFPTALALGAQLMVSVADGVPYLNVNEVCDGIAKQGGVTFHDPAIAKEKQVCLESEEAMRQEIAKQWSTFAASDKIACTNESRMGGESSYTELLTCLEMARDVKRLREEYMKASSEAAKPKTAPAPAPAAAPAITKP